MRLTLATAVCMCFALPAASKPPLSEVSEIDNGLMTIAIADEIRKNCDDISARLIRAYQQIKTLERRAKALGYSDDEIDTYVNSDSEKARMRQKANAYLAAQGVSASDTKALCRFGRDQITAQGPVGYFLR